MKYFWAAQVAVALLLGSACSPRTSPPPPRTETPSPLPAAPVQALPISSSAPKPDKFWDAIATGKGASSLAQYASGKEDWELIVYYFQTAVADLKAIPATSPNLAQARVFVKRYEKNLADARKMVSGELKAPPATLLDNSGPSPPPPPPKPVVQSVPIPVVVPASVPVTTTNLAPTQAGTEVRQTEVEIDIDIHKDKHNKNTKPKSRPQRVRVRRR